MILKSFEINKIKLKTNKIVLFYGKNEGLKNETTKNIFDKNNDYKITTYEEKEILDHLDNFFESIKSKSLFEDKKILIIKRVSEKILHIIEQINPEKLDDIFIILYSDNLEKKSKLRNYFEKSKKYICIAFYPDNDQTLSKLAYNFFQERKIPISPSNINLIVNKCSGNRESLLNQLIKIENFARNKKKIDSVNISKLINLSEDYNVSELVNNCLAKNKKKIINILNENNFKNEDTIIITRNLLNKSKKILKLSEEFKKNKNIELTISSAKPPIFWKEKEITTQQIYKWKPENIKELIYKLNNIELITKKNINNSINVLSDFILEQSSN